MIDDSALMDPELLPDHVWKILERVGVQRKFKQKQNSNDFLKAAVQSAFESALKTDVSKIKFNANCPKSEKVGSGPGSCSGKNIAEKNSRVSSKLPPISTKFAKELSEDESDSLRSYSTDSYSYISAYLNNKNVSDASGSTFTSSNKELTLLAGYIESLNFDEDKVKEKIYYIDNAMEKSTTESDGIVYSGLGKEKSALVANLKVGDTTTFNGYTSASKRLNITGFFIPKGLEKNIVLKINVPKGTNAIDMERFANPENKKQYEVLLHKGITYKKVGETNGNISYRGQKIPVSIVEVEITNPMDDSPRISWEPDTMTANEHKKEYDNTWKSAYDSIREGVTSIKVPEKMADPFRRYKTRIVSIGDEITYAPDMYSGNKTSKIIEFKQATEKSPSGKLLYKVDAIIESGESVDLSKHKLRKERNGLKQNSLQSLAQSAFEEALRSNITKVKFNWNCKQEEKSGTGPGSCKGVAASKDAPESYFHIDLDSVPSYLRSLKETRNTIEKIQYDIVLAEDEKSQVTDWLGVRGEKGNPKNIKEFKERLIEINKELDGYHSELSEVESREKDLEDSIKDMRNGLEIVNSDIQKRFYVNNNARQNEWSKVEKWRFIERRQFQGKCDITKLANKRQGEIMDSVMKGFDAECQKLGIPPIRGLTTGILGGVADAGDGIIRFDPESLDASIHCNRDIIRNQIEEKVKKATNTLEKLKGLMVTSPSQKGMAEEVISVYGSAINKYNDGDDSLMPWNWSPQNLNAIKPYWGSMYFDDPEKSEEYTIQHELAHHIHQYMGIGDAKTFDVFATPLETKLYELYRNRDPNLDPTEYCSTNANEWFAENRALWKLDKKDLVSPNLIDLMNKIDSGKVEL